MVKSPLAHHYGNRHHTDVFASRGSVPHSPYQPIHQFKGDQVGLILGLCQEFAKIKHNQLGLFVLNA